MAQLGLKIAGALTLSAAALAVGTVPALAADVATLACPLEALGAGERAQLEDTVRRQGKVEEAGMQALYRSVFACSRRHGWSEAAAQQAVVYSLADVGQRQARATLESWEVDVNAIERALLADRAVVDSARTDAVGDQTVRFFEGLPPGLRASIEAHGNEGAEVLGTFLVFRSAVENGRADFAAR